MNHSDLRSRLLLRRILGPSPFTALKLGPGQTRGFSPGARIGASWNGQSRSGKLRFDGAQAGDAEDEDENEDEEAARWRALAARLERQARESPRLYRAKVLALAVCGYAFVPALLLLVGALLVVLLVIAAKFPGALVVVFKSLGLGYLVFAAFVLRACIVRHDAPEGIEIQPKEAPALFQTLEHLRARLDAPRIDGVFIDEAYNAFAEQSSWLGLPIGRRNYVTIGLPLLQSLSVSELEAVMAHELGHISGSHGHVGNWIYRMRMTWYQVLEVLEAQPHWSSIAFRYFLHWFAPFFSAYSFALARGNEYEADALASKAVGRRPVAAALTRTAVEGGLLATVFQRDFDRAVKAGAVDCAGPFSAMADYFARLVPDKAMDRSLKAALKERSNYQNTHPCLKDRLSSLSMPPTLLPRRAEEAAGPVLLGATYDALVADFDRRWYEHNKQTVAWARQQAEENRERLKTLLVAEMNGGLEDDERTELATLTEILYGFEAAIPYYEAALQADPGSAEANFAVGRARLEEGSEEGLALLIKAAEGKLSMAPEACDLADEWLEERGVEGLKKFQALRRRWHAAVANAQAERAEAHVEDELGVPALDAVTRERLAAVFHRARCVERAYVLEKPVAHLPEFPCWILVALFKSDAFTPEQGCLLEQGLAPFPLVHHLYFEEEGDDWLSRAASLPDALVYQA